MINKNESSDITSKNELYKDDEEDMNNDDIKNVEVFKTAIIYTIKGSIMNI